MEKFKITKEQLEFMENHSNFIHTSMDNKYSFIPFWVEHKDDNNITLHSLGNLPKDLSDYITNSRNATSNVPVNEEDHKKEFPLTPEEFNESIYPMNKAMMDKRYSGKHINLKELGIIEDETLNFGINLNDSDDEDQ